MQFVFTANTELSHFFVDSFVRFSWIHDGFALWMEWNAFWILVLKNNCYCCRMSSVICECFVLRYFQLPIQRKKQFILCTTVSEQWTICPKRQCLKWKIHPLAAIECSYQNIHFIKIIWKYFCVLPVVFVAFFFFLFPLYLIQLRIKYNITFRKICVFWHSSPFLHEFVDLYLSRELAFFWMIPLKAHSDQIDFEFLFKRTKYRYIIIFESTAGESWEPVFFLY